MNPVVLAQDLQLFVHRLNYYVSVHGGSSSEAKSLEALGNNIRVEPSDRKEARVEYAKSLSALAESIVDKIKSDKSEVSEAEVAALLKGIGTAIRACENLDPERPINARSEFIPLLSDALTSISQSAKMPAPAVQTKNEREKRLKTEVSERRIPNLPFDKDTAYLVSKNEISFYQTIKSLAGDHLKKLPRASLVQKQIQEGRFDLANYFDVKNIPPENLEKIKAMVCDPKRNVMKHSIILTDAGVPIAIFHNKDKETSAIGSGGFADTRVGQELLTGKVIAIKVIHNAEKRKESTGIEYDVLAGLSRSILGKMERATNAKDKGKEKSYIPQQWAPEKSLEATLKGDTSTSDKFKIATATAEAIEVWHQRGIIHADIKPGNFQCLKTTAGDYEVMAVDPGFSRILAAGQHQFVLESEKTQGSPFYIAPETARKKTGLSAKNEPTESGLPVYSRATDSYQMGVTLAEIFYPDIKVLRGSNYENPKIDLPALHQDQRLNYAAEVIRACLDPDATKRPTMAEVRKMMQDIAQEEYKPVQDILGDLKTSGHPEERIDASSLHEQQAVREYVMATLDKYLKKQTKPISEEAREVSAFKEKFESAFVTKEDVQSLLKIMRNTDPLTETTRRNLQLPFEAGFAVAQQSATHSVKKILSDFSSAELKSKIQAQAKDVNNPKNQKMLQAFLSEVEKLESRLNSGGFATPGSTKPLLDLAFAAAMSLGINDPKGLGFQIKEALYKPITNATAVVSEKGITAAKDTKASPVVEVAVSSAHSIGAH